MDDPNKPNGEKPAENIDQNKKPEGSASGVNFVKDEGQTPPPLGGAAAPGAEEIPPGSGERTPGEEIPPGGQVAQEPVDISVDFVEITLGSVGTIAFQFTGYSPFQFTQKELQTIANLAAACEIKAPARIQLIIGLVTLLGAKIGGYVLWRRAGKPPIHFDADGNMLVGDIQKLVPTEATK
jgi:hypothetical protein